MKLKKILATVIIAFSAACSRNIYTFSNLDIYVAPELSPGAAEVKERLADLHAEPGGRFTLKITVYSYSEGPEVLALEGDRLSSGRSRGWMKGMIQVLDGEEIVDVFFIEVYGSDKNEVLERFSAEAVRLVSGLGR